VLADAVVEDGRLRIGEETYEVFIMPPTTHVKESTYLKLREFLEAGGCVITDTLVPVALLDSKEFGEGVVPLERGFFGINGAKVLEAFEQHEEEPFDLVHLQAEGNFFFFKGDGLYSKKMKIQEMSVEIKKALSFVLTETGLERARTVEQFVVEQGELYERKERTLRRVLRECIEPDVTI